MAMCDDDDVVIEGTVVRGHQVASGTNCDPLFPGGTLAMQVPFFKALGLDLSEFHLATVNLSITPRDWRYTKPDYTFRDVQWHPTEPPEDFSFSWIKGWLSRSDTGFGGLIYYPHPETKPAHHQPRGLIELIFREEIPGLEYGSTLFVKAPGSQLDLT